MELRVIGPQQVIDLLPMPEDIEVVDGAMRSASSLASAYHVYENATRRGVSVTAQF